MFLEAPEGYVEEVYVSENFLMLLESQEDDGRGVREKLEETDEDVTYDKIASEMNIAVSEVAYALDAISDPVSLYEPVFNKAGDTLLLMDQIFDEKNNDEVWTEKAALPGRHPSNSASRRLMTTAS